jgi:serine protease Do
MQPSTLRALALATALAPLAAGGPLPWGAALAQPVQVPAGPLSPPPGAPVTFADLAAKLAPAVVNISSTQKAEARNDIGPPDMPQFPPGSPFEQFFRDFLNRNHPGGNGGGPNGQQRSDRGGNGGGGGGDDAPPPGHPPIGRAVSLGSGFIIDPSGIIVTNNHVIANAEEVTVTLTDNTTFKAKILGVDTRVDLAVLKVDAGHPLPSVSFGDSGAARVGDWVLAIGNPFGLGGSVTAGIVSARGRDIRQGPYDDFIQTDAPINRGNSGGPLFNMQGQVIGINTAIYSPSGGSVGIGFSLPSSLAKQVVGQLVKYGQVKRGWLGVSIQQVTPDIADSLRLPRPEGALVGNVNPGAPADQAGIQPGDVILKFDGQDVSEMHNLPLIVAETDIGKEVPVTVWRDGKEVSLHAKVAELPANIEQANASGVPGGAAPRANPELSGLGVHLAPLSDDTRGKFNLSADVKGVVITDVDPNGPAAAKGVKPGDVIVEVQQQPVKSPADVQQRLEHFRQENRRTVLFLIQSGDNLRWVPLPLADNGGSKSPG